MTYDMDAAGRSTYVQKFPPMAIITKVSVQNCAKNKTAHEANVAPIITKGSNGGTHVLSRVKLKMLIFTKHIVYYSY